MIKEPSVLLQHILESIKLIEKRMENVSYDEFVDDIDLQDMIIRRIEIIGEGVRNLSKEFREAHSHITWQNPADMRSVLIHGYLEVDLEVIWDTVTKDLPQFKKQIEDLLEAKSL